MVPEPAGFSLSAVESPSCSASSFCMGPRVSLYGQRVVQWSPLQIRQDTIFCPFSLFMGSSSWSWAFKSCKRRQGPQSQAKPSKLQINTAVKGCVYALCGLLHNNEQQCTIVTLTSLLEMKVMKTSSLTVVVATLGPGASHSEMPNFFQF